MTIDDVQEMVEPVLTLQDRLAKRYKPVPLELPTQYLGNRITRRFYPEHWAQVQLVRATAQTYGS